MNPMARKITISVPDELYEKMNQWRASLNFSKIFQKTIAAMIQKKEEFHQKLKEEFDFSAIIERLKREKSEIESNFFETGKKDALEWLQTAHYKDILYALKWEPTESFSTDETLGDYFAHKLKKICECGVAEMNSQCMKANQIIQKYLAGWKEGVLEFWNAVKDEVYA